MASRIRIAIDSMGGDSGLHHSLPAAIQSLSLLPDLDIILVGDQSAIETQLSVPADFSSRLSIRHASQTVAMSEKPSHALRKKPDSSIRVAVDMLRAGEVDAVVSAGNTGALMAIGCYVLKTLPGIDRPAICSAIPTGKGHCYLLDLGANVDSSAEHLYQFAIMGSAMCSAVDGINSPKVALLNIGEESIKGNEQVKLAAKLLADDKQLNYQGFIEGDKVFQGHVDVIVCDGFAGNVALKVCEGTATYITKVVKREFGRNFFTRLLAKLCLPVLRRVFCTLDPEQYNGASFLGLQGVVVKSHGASSVEGFVVAIKNAHSEVERGMLDMIDKKLALLVE